MLPRLLRRVLMSWLLSLPGRSKCWWPDEVEKVKLFNASRKKVEDKNYKGTKYSWIWNGPYSSPFSHSPPRPRFLTGFLVWTFGDALDRKEVEASRVGDTSDKGGSERSLRAKAWPYFQPYYLFLYLSICEKLLTHASATTPQTLPCLFCMLDGKPWAQINPSSLELFSSAILSQR